MADSVKRFVSRLRGDASDRNRIRPMWEPEFGPAGRDARDWQRLVLALIVALAFALGAILL